MVSTVEAKKKTAMERRTPGETCRKKRKREHLHLAPRAKKHTDEGESEENF